MQPVRVQGPKLSAACHARAVTAQDTPWPRIAALYDALDRGLRYVVRSATDYAAVMRPLEAGAEDVVD